jgi:hypothetical protein
MAQHPWWWQQGQQGSLWQEAAAQVQQQLRGVRRRQWAREEAHEAQAAVHFLPRLLLQGRLL